ncbi:hypothetical protein J6590_106112, partial [Homalodisca vitripennis]
RRPWDAQISRKHSTMARARAEVTSTTIQVTRRRAARRLCRAGKVAQECAGAGRSPGSGACAVQGVTAEPGPGRPAKLTVYYNYGYYS